MSERLAPTLLAVLIDRDERTHEKIVARFEKCARDNEEDATLSVRTLRRWMAGRVLTEPRPSQRRVARLFWGHPMNELLAPPPPGFHDRPDDPTTVGAAQPPQPTMSPLPSPDGVIDDLERRVTMATRRAAQFTTLAEVDNVGPEAIEQLRDTVSQLANAYPREPLITVLRELPDIQETIFRLLEGKQRPTLTKDLYLLAGMVSGMIAKASHDLGRPYDAMTHARTSYVCAGNAGHPGLKAWARGLQSLISYWAGRPQEAVRYAQNGAETAPDCHGSVSAWLPALEARAWALMSATNEATLALAKANNRRQAHRPDDLDTIGGLLTFPQAKQRYYTAGTLVHLNGQQHQAQTEALAAIDLYEQENPENRSYSDEAGAHTELALARVRNNEIDGAHDALSPVLNLPPERRIGGILISTTRIHQALSQQHHTGSPTIRTIQEEIETFCRVPAAALSA